MNSETSEQITDRNSLFPLPLSDFEYYMFVDNRPTHPMVLTLVTHLSGSLDRMHFTAAVNSALSRHPLLNCRVQKRPKLGWCWVADWNEPPRIDWSESSAELDDRGSASTDQPLSYMNLQQESGLRVFVTASPDRSRVLFQFHHACCDGAGGVEFLGDVFANYGLATVTEHAEAPTLGTSKLSQLVRRDVHSITATGGIQPRRSLWRILGQARRLLLRRITPVVGIRHVRESDPRSLSGSRMMTQVLSKEVTRQLRNASQSLSATVNDVCALELFRLIRCWNQRASDDSSNRWIRVVIPVSLRTPDHDYMPAANLVSCVFVTRTSAECDDAASLLQTIRKQTGNIFHQQEGLVLLKCLRFLRRVPGLLSLVLRTKSCFGSVILAYVGDVRRLFSGHFPQHHGQWVAGNVTIERIEGVAPVRPNTRAAISIGLYAGELILNLRADRATLSLEDATEFLAQFVDRLERIAVTGRILDDAESSVSHAVPVDER